LLFFFLGQVIKILHYYPISTCFQHIAAFPGSIARQHCPAALPGSIARQHCPAALPGSIARQHCPAALPGSIARQHCPAALPGSKLFYGRNAVYFKPSPPLTRHCHFLDSENIKLITFCKVGRGSCHCITYFLNLHALGYPKSVTVLFCEHCWVNKSLSMM
jgi:hypothetical protein